MRRLGWISLFVLLLMAACGPPEVHDINGGGSGVGGDDDDTTTGDDDDDAATTFPTGTTPPGGAPTLTNVPSFATWDASVRPLGCFSCHSGGSGGLYMAPNDATNKKYYWFSAICNRDDGNAANGVNEGTQSYSPPSGRFRTYMSGNEPAGHTAIGNNATVIDNWMAQGAGTTPPNCNDYYDLTNSS